MRVIAIEIHGPNDFTVRERDRYCDRLCWDEMLGSVAELTHPRIGEARYRMQTREEHAERESKWRAVQHPVYAKPPLLEAPGPNTKIPELELGADGTIRTKYPTMSREWVASVADSHASLAPIFVAAPSYRTALEQIAAGATGYLDNDTTLANIAKRALGIAVDE
ncbi:hypothetical protein [Paraburkholderia sp. RL17-373-BIF-A]|uniref:hypothetical protein n=1 Tax=Paraburkholderia sp. RL17-373-BIF-A TaxID=3031629 RepID=UPI0038B82566